MVQKNRTVAVYARVSTEHEAQISALENQVQYYDNLMSMHPEWTLYKLYVDEGITGTSTKKRKNFMQMMSDAEDKKFDLIITREVSRFARNTVDTLQETRKLKKLGIEVWFTEDNIWTMNDEDGELRLTIMATLAQNESKKTSQRVKAGQMISFQNAVPYGNGNILGYDRVEIKTNGKVERKFVINPEQARVVRLIFDMYLAGNGIRKIQLELMQRGELTATGLTRWESANISRILGNEFYAGIIEYRKQYVPDYLEQKKINNFGDVPTVRVRGTHEPIITEEEYEKCAEIRNRKTTSINNRGRVGRRELSDVWVEKMVCSCGSNFNRRLWRRVNGVNQYCYQCRDQVRFGSVKTRENHGLDTTDTCRVKMVPIWKMQAMAAKIFNEFWSDRKQVICIANELIEDNKLDPVYSEVENKIEDKKKEIQKLIRQKKNLVELRINETIDDDIYKEKYDKLNYKISVLEKEVSDLEGTITVTPEEIENKLKVIKYALEQEFEFSEKGIPEEVVKAFVDKIVVHEDHFEWYLNFNPNCIKCIVDGTAKKHELTLENNPTSVNYSTGCYCKQVILLFR